MEENSMNKKEIAIEKLQSGQWSKKWEDLTFADNFIFCVSSTLKNHQMNLLRELMKRHFLQNKMSYGEKNICFFMISWKMKKKKFAK